MTLPMSDERMAVLCERAELFAVYGDKDALSPDDVCELVADVRACHVHIAHLVALHRRDLEQLGRIAHVGGTVPL
jgi:hypothetical protein